MKIKTPAEFDKIFNQGVKIEEAKTPYPFGAEESLEPVHISNSGRSLDTYFPVFTTCTYVDNIHN